MDEEGVPERWKGVDGRIGFSTGVECFSFTSVMKQRPQTCVCVCVSVSVCVCVFRVCGASRHQQRDALSLVYPVCVPLICVRRVKCSKQSETLCVRPCASVCCVCVCDRYFGCLSA